MLDKNTRYHMIVVGTGGTGTTFLRDIGRYINNKKLSAIGGCPIVKVSLIDGDIVEDKNLERQIFYKRQVGMNKAVAMEQMLHRSYPSVPMQAYGDYLTDLEQIEKIVSTEANAVPLIIGCVDNHACRILLEEYFSKVSDCIYFDSGNEYCTGEVVMAFKIGNKVLSPVKSVWFPDIKEGDLRPVTEISCSELNAVDPQHPLVNIMAGGILNAAVVNLCEGRAKYSCVYFDAQEFSQTAVPINL